VSPKRLRSMWILSILTFGLLGLWLLKFNPGERSLPVAQLEMETRPVVKIRQGKIIGGELNAANYPQVPVNASRKEFDAGKYGSRCPAGLYDSTPIGEDCLNLNIYRPKDRDPDKLLPVLVYFHGGAFNFGAGQNRAIDHMVAWSAEPMLGLSFNYRVGAFGFLPSRLTARERLLNVGLKDQRCLLEWVQENVAAFGGDPDNVTIMGSSAGAHSVCLFIFMPASAFWLYAKSFIDWTSSITQPR
jgi:acetylcholinesterase